MTIHGAKITDPYGLDKLQALKKCANDEEIIHLLNRIYEDGFQDGFQQGLEEREELL